MKEVAFAPASSVFEPGSSPKAAVALTWPTFSEAAEDAANSRQLGGIHFTESLLRSAIAGGEVAGVTWDRYTQLLNGGAPQ